MPAGDPVSLTPGHQRRSQRDPVPCLLCPGFSPDESPHCGLVTQMTRLTPVCYCKEPILDAGVLQRCPLESTNVASPQAWLRGGRAWTSRRTSSAPRPRQVCPDNTQGGRQDPAAGSAQTGGRGAADKKRHQLGSPTTPGGPLPAGAAACPFSLVTKAGPGRPDGAALPSEEARRLRSQTCWAGRQSRPMGKAQTTRHSLSACGSSRLGRSRTWGPAMRTGSPSPGGATASGPGTTAPTLSHGITEPPAQSPTGSGSGSPFRRGGN